jgi:clan AA aspartic protease
MVWLPLPGGQLSNSGVGHFRVTVEVGDRPGKRFAPIEALVDTGATYTWVPRDVLEGVGVTPEEEVPFELADGGEARYPVTWTQLRIGARTRATVVVFADRGSEPILGVVALEEFGLAVDPVHRRLISVPALL